MPSITIAIPAYNRNRETRELLQSILDADAAGRVNAEKLDPLRAAKIDSINDQRVGNHCMESDHARVCTVLGASPEELRC
jgi:hypothetical protein